MGFAWDVQAGSQGSSEPDPELMAREPPLFPSFDSGQDLGLARVALLYEISAKALKTIYRPVALLSF